MASVLWRLIIHPWQAVLLFPTQYNFYYDTKSVPWLLGWFFPRFDFFLGGWPTGLMILHPLTAITIVSYGRLSPIHLYLFSLLYFILFITGLIKMDWWVGLGRLGWVGWLGGICVCLFARAKIFDVRFGCEFCICVLCCASYGLGIGIGWGNAAMAVFLMIEFTRVYLW